MIRLGEMQELEIVRRKEFGVFLAETADSEESVLLPAKQVPENAEVGDRINVFLYRDSKDRLIATTAAPKLLKGETALLTVSDVTRIGAFLDMGLEKELLLPFREQMPGGALHRQERQTGRDYEGVSLSVRRFTL